MSVSFTKMHSLGNDFMIVDALEQPLHLSANKIKQMSNRQKGIGFDQLLVIEPTRDCRADFYYRIFNADGSEVGQCGNGARCVLSYLRQQKHFLGSSLCLQTMATFIHCRYLPNDRYLVELPPPKFKPEDIPCHLESLRALKLECGIVNVGNPHAVFFSEDVASVDLSQWSLRLSAASCFPEGVNLSVACISSHDILRLRVFERGVGETLACGSAACAAVVLACQRGCLSSKALVLQAGGDLEIIWQGEGCSIKMIGDAKFVFRGEYFL